MVLCTLLGSVHVDRICMHVHVLSEISDKRCPEVWGVYPSISSGLVDTVSLHACQQGESGLHACTMRWVNARKLMLAIVGRFVFLHHVHLIATRVSISSGCWIGDYGVGPSWRARRHPY